MEKDDKKKAESRVGIQETEPGSSWQNPGDFPEFQGKQQLETSEQTEETEKKKPDYEAMANEYRARTEALRNREVPEGKFKFPDEVFDAVLKRIEDALLKEDEGWRSHFLTEARSDLEKLDRLVGEVDAEVGERLWSLYSDPEISVGVHGCTANRESDKITENSTFFRDGIGCAWRNMSRTIAFQDRRMHIHGLISFPELLIYEYPSGSMDSDSPSIHCAVIAAIPSSLDARDERLVSEPGDLEIESGYRRRTVKAFTLKPEFVVGIIPGRKPNNVVWNPKFNEERVHELFQQGVAEKEQRDRELEESYAAYNREWAERKAKEARSLKGRLKRLFGRGKE